MIQPAVPTHPIGNWRIAAVASPHRRGNSPRHPWPRQAGPAYAVLSAPCGTLAAMSNESGLAAYLATLDAEALAALLSARSDALGIPPSSLVDLADRLSLPQSVKVAVRGL